MATVIVELGSCGCTTVVVVRNLYIGCVVKRCEHQYYNLNSSITVIYYVYEYKALGI